MGARTVIVVAGGGDPARPAPAPLPEGATVIAADGGVDRALALGLQIDVAVGDFDSVSEAGLAAATRAGARVERHPVAKDATDLELALDEAAALAPTRLVVLGHDGGRLDHLLAVLLLLGADRYAAVELDAYLGDAEVRPVRGVRRLSGAIGGLVSLLALHGAAQHVTTEGLAYPLRGETILPGSTRGVSNVFTHTVASVSVECGVLLAVQPAPEPGREESP